MSQLKISVIIPTCHRNDLLEKCLDRLAPGAQTLPITEYEVIVTDDGSKTNAEKLVHEKYPWARWVEGPRRGPAANRNNGARHAQGEWLVFTDDDCLPSPQWLEEYKKAIEEKILVYEGKTICKIGIQSPLMTAPVNLTGGYLWSCNMMTHKILFDELSGFDENFPYAAMEDVDFRERLKQRGYEFPFVEGATVDHPPRRLPWGTVLSAQQESYIMMWYKSGNTKPVRGVLLYRTMKSRLNTIRKNRFGPDSFVALISLVCEITLALYRLPKWEKKYRRRFKHR